MEPRTDIVIEEVKKFSPGVKKDVIRLLEQVTVDAQELTDEHFQYLVNDPSTHLFVAKRVEDDAIVAMATLIVYRIPYKMKAQLEDVVVDEAVRGKGIGKYMLNYVIEKAKEFGVKSLNLTSSPRKDIANKMYMSLGFEKRETNAYRKNL